MKNNIAWATPLVSALLLAEKELDRHWHPRHETIEKEVTIMNSRFCWRLTRYSGRARHQQFLVSTEMSANLIRS